MTKERDDYQNEAWIEMAFQALMSGAGSYGLIPCTVNGEPSSVIALGRESRDGRSTQIMPLFAALTPGMKLVFPGDLDRDGGGGGGPKRASVSREFAANKTALTR